MGFRSTPARLFTTLRASLRARQELAVSPKLHSQPEGRGGQASCGQAKGGHICLRRDGPPGATQPTHNRCSSKCLAVTQFRTRETLAGNEWPGEAGKVCLSMRPKQTRIRKNKEPGSQGWGGWREQMRCCKKNMGACSWGLRKLNEDILKSLQSKDDWENTSRKDLPHKAWLFVRSNPKPVPTYPLSFSLSHSCLHMCPCVHIAAAKMSMHAPGCWLLLFMQMSLKDKVKTCGSRIELTLLMFLSPSSWGQEHICHFFFIPSHTYY